MTDKKDSQDTPIDRGRSIIRDFAQKLPKTSGVYRMLGEGERVLYVGKAKNLQRRVSSYTNVEQLSTRKKRMVAETLSMEVAHTKTEVEALLLEANMITKLKPRYNILLRDDKMNPYIHMSTDKDFPRLMSYRGAQRKTGLSYGPFASAGAVYQTLDALYKVFQLRNCSDNVFKNRSRPCLQYHIKRCTAPCVGKVSQTDYAQQVKNVQNFLEGKETDIRNQLNQKMQNASTAQEYELAAYYRDQLEALAKIQTQQDINVADIVRNADVIVAHQEADITCVQVFFYRNGRNFGNQAYFPKHDKDTPIEDVLSAFMGQFYQRFEAPKDILLSHKVADQQLIEDMLSERVGTKVSTQVPQRGKKLRLIDQARENAKYSHTRYMSEHIKTHHLLGEVAEAFSLDDTPERIEVYDNSHISGSKPVGVVIVATSNGFDTNAYRKYNIKHASETADDYAMMREVIDRRFSKMIKAEEEENSVVIWPDLLIIDGGKGQLSAVTETLDELGLSHLPVVAVSKGPERKAGEEKFHIRDKLEFTLPANSQVFYYIQRLRDEAHRFALGSHRTRRKKAIYVSPLDEISGIGAKRKKALLSHFGSAKAVGQAAVEDLLAVEGVSESMAEKIYAFFQARH